MAFKAEHDIRRQGLPATPEGYELKLADDFKAPDGINFQFDQNSPQLANFRRLAHAKQWDQQIVSEAVLDWNEVRRAVEGAREDIKAEEAKRVAAAEAARVAREEKKAKRAAPKPRPASAAAQPAHP